MFPDLSGLEGLFHVRQDVLAAFFIGMIAGQTWFAILTKWKK
jgi:hypothetical protein